MGDNEEVEAHQDSDKWSSKAKQYSAMASKGSVVYHFSETACGLLMQQDISQLIDGGTLLDVCAGPAVFSVATMTRIGVDTLNSAHFIISDFSAGMIEAAREAVEAVSPCRPNTQFLIMDVQNIELPSDSVHVIGCMFGYFVPDRHMALAEIYRVCQPEGCAVFGTWKYTGLVYVLGDFLSFLGGTWDYSSMPVAYACADGDVLRGELETIGFSAVQIHEHSHKFDLPLEGDALTSVFGNPIISTYLTTHMPEKKVHIEWERFINQPDFKYEVDMEKGTVSVRYTANIAFARK